MSDTAANQVQLMDPLDLELAELSSSLKDHQIFDQPLTIDAVRTLLEQHVFIIWSSMSLLKRIQIEYTNVSIPWCPVKQPNAARLVNEIVLREESGPFQAGQYCSRYDHFLSVMEEIGASTLQIRNFVHLVNANMPVQDALSIVGASPEIQLAVKSIIQLAVQGSTEEVLGGFVYGRGTAILGSLADHLDSWQPMTGATTTTALISYIRQYSHTEAAIHELSIHELKRYRANDNQDSLSLFRTSAIARIEEQRHLVLDALITAELASHANRNVQIA